MFGCISSSGTIEGTCQYNNDPNACGYGIAIGVLAFLGLMALLVSDAIFDNISSIQQRKYIVIGDVVFSGMNIELNRSIFRAQGSFLSGYVIWDICRVLHPHVKGLGIEYLHQYHPKRVVKAQYWIRL